MRPVERKESSTASIFDSLTLRLTPQSGERAGYDGAFESRQIAAQVIELRESVVDIIKPRLIPVRADQDAIGAYTAFRSFPSSFCRGQKTTKRMG